MRHTRTTGSIVSALMLLILPSVVRAHYEELIVTGARPNLIGDAVSASQGGVGQEEIAIRPILRTGEVLELVPGMVVTQHSGSGKANQYFLRGFNLDHGSDFSVSVDRMPVNMRTHGHGQGYTDINFLIPELVQELVYKKGPYYAETGDFSGSGAAEFSLYERLDKSLVKLEAGQDQWGRALMAGSAGLGRGDLLYAVETTRYDGPWTDISEDMRKTSFMLRYYRGADDDSFSLTLMGYDNQWNSADQIPRRAVVRGIIDSLGSIDDTVGGESGRYSLSARWRNGGWDATAYVISYEMNLWSNFTYLLADPVNGDQFEQVDDRVISGGEISHTHDSTLGGRPVTYTGGLQVRNDAIGEVGLHQTAARRRFNTIRQDEVDELSAALYWQAELQVSERLRGIFGVRYDSYAFDVASNIAGNSGDASDDIASAKLNISYALNDNWELYAGIGQGFHSNDARGVTITVDPVSGDPADAVDPLVSSEGAELGARLFVSDRLNASFAMWTLRQDSELLFVGDAGNTEASRASRRDGYELTAYYRINPHWTADLEWAWTDGEFTEDEPGEGKEIDGSLQLVVAAGISAAFDNGWFGSLRARHLGERTLDSSGDAKSDPLTVLNLRAGWRTQGGWEFSADVLNLLDSDDHDIDYFYESRLPGETASAEDIHFHPIEPRTVRFTGSFHY